MCEKKILLSLLIVIISNLTIANAYSRTSKEQEILTPEIKAGLHASLNDPTPARLVFATHDSATHWLNSMSYRLARWVADDFLRKRYLTIIQYEAKRAGLDPQLVLSVITVESRFNKYAISSVGAVGLMQIMPFWQTEIGDTNQDLFDVKTNLRYGCAILHYYLQQEHGDLYLALKRYNGINGNNNYPELIYNTYRTYWKITT